MTPLAREPARGRGRLDFPFAMINIIMLLLFFFIVTGSIVGGNETGVVPPETEALPPERLPRPLLLIDRAGNLFLDDVPVASTQLVERLVRTGQRPGASPVVNIVADAAFSGERFLAIVEDMRSAGLAVRVVTLRTAAGD